MGLLSDAFGALLITCVDMLNEARHAQEAEEEELAFSVNRVIELGKMFVSVWVYAFWADGEVSEEEKDFFEQLVNDFFLCDDSVVLRDLDLEEEDLEYIREEIFDAIEHPLPITEIKTLSKGDSKLRVILFEQAAMCVAADQIVNKPELKFLKDLARELRISAMDRDRIFEECGIT